jgi:hypothetical protein
MKEGQYLLSYNLIKSGLDRLRSFKTSELIPNFMKWLANFPCFMGYIQIGDETWFRRSNQGPKTA